MARRCFFLVLALAMTSSFGLAGSKYDSRIARLSLIEGHVTFQHAQDVEWSAASINMALQPSDRIYTGEDGRAEIQFDDGSILRLAEKTDVEILSLKEDSIQVRILVGLSTLTVQSSVAFEINTPAAAFNTVRKGIYRFDVNENGDADAIVRKGLLDAANNNFSKQIESGELVHVTAGERGSHTVSRYDRRDQWDEWNDRRNADLLSYESRKYLPEYVSVGAQELDRYGRWVVVQEYGPAWVPAYVDSAWSPYWNGRWCYRPFWGWTWVSYEPWGWLPYHYGRWHYGINVGWCWLPGPSFGFHFWSPGLVRFYDGPGWISWCPLGPGDYYNVNNYFYHSSYAYHLNSLRLVQRRGPEDLANRNARGAFRTAGIEHFRNGSFGPQERALLAQGVDRPWIQGRLLNGQPGVEPTSRSFAPLPDRQVAPPPNRVDRPVVVRTEPGLEDGMKTRFSRITNPAIAPLPVTRSRTDLPWQERGESSGTGRPAGSSSGDSRSDPGGVRQGLEGAGQRPGTWNRRGPENPDSGSSDRGRPESGGLPGSTGGYSPRVYGRGSSGAAGSRPDHAPARPQQRPSSAPGRYERAIPEQRQPGVVDNPRSEPRTRQDSVPARPSASPYSPTNRNDRQPSATRPPEAENPPAGSRQRRSESASPGASNSQRYFSPSYDSWQSHRIERIPQGNAWAPSRPFSAESRAGAYRPASGGGYATPRTEGSHGGIRGVSSAPEVRAVPGSRPGGSSAISGRRDR